ncbi:hypothetical protein N781_10515 [Pontibacillus halophilus JSM 076056 = DSM 19796]|uniref:ATP-grasp domain-containing protein n=1 Tax=Pontibacillus halophilus JSM 076056 = DSM 19796 TaxID=1385510 RepID=A0A0A5GJQ0_9BACI|nr:RimK family alpha-L-glutamate ligase [Pontibacillus halophilus]KGX93471.1 hypothetical protein N781_10515 [Pontibacillus halophilus JSM 076056 = DSM 19796]
MTYYGWILYNGHLSGDKFKDYADLLQKAASEAGVRTDIKQNNELLPLLTTNENRLLSNETLPDFVLFGDKDLYLARQLEQLGIPVYNSSRSIELCDDKSFMYQKLAKENFPIPKTILGPKIYRPSQDLSLPMEAVEKELLYPMVIKEAFGSFGEQVYLVHNRNEMMEVVQEIHHRPFLFQQFVSTSYGRDLRLNVVGDRVVAAMKRYSTDDFRANITRGGSMEPYDPTEEEVDLAIRATKAVEADFAGVDLLFGESGEPILCEINGNAQIRNIYECTGINVSDKMVDYVVQDLNTKRGNQQ